MIKHSHWCFAVILSLALYFVIMTAFRGSRKEIDGLRTERWIPLAENHAQTRITLCEIEEKNFKPNKEKNEKTDEKK